MHESKVNKLKFYANFYFIKMSIENRKMAGNMSTVEKIKIIELWNELKSIVDIQRKYCTIFNVQIRSAPSKYVINRIYRNFVQLAVLVRRNFPEDQVM